MKIWNRLFVIIGFFLLVPASFSQTERTRAGQPVQPMQPVQPVTVQPVQQVQPITVQPRHPVQPIPVQPAQPLTVQPIREVNTNSGYFSPRQAYLDFSRPEGFRERYIEGVKRGNYHGWLPREYMSNRYYYDSDW